jgi:hypothetical protein
MMLLATFQELSTKQHTANGQKDQKAVADYVWYRMLRLRNSHRRQ